MILNEDVNVNERKREWLTSILLEFAIQLQQSLQLRNKCDSFEHK